ncbi:hypothetical protein F5Y19DRAFT_163803 [Xylariaceae sp. FL1651]|nr:hypothetical protein F5Y19DRAFT_163803 [Xylariaceae sp. FL1651]
MALTSRITLRRRASSDVDGAEDFFASSLGVIFPDDVTARHGDNEHPLIYTSPHLPRTLDITISDPNVEQDRMLYSHYLWNASLQLAEFVEAGSLGLPLSVGVPTLRRGDDGHEDNHGKGKEEGFSVANFDIRGQRTLELGAGTALPSIMASLLGAHSVAVTDYPSDMVLRTLRQNIAANCTRIELSPYGTLAPVTVAGHSWGEVDDGSGSDSSGNDFEFTGRNCGAFDRIFVSDCLWMPEQHENLRKSISHFLKERSLSSGASAVTQTAAEGHFTEPQAWVVAGFHTGRAKVIGFFNAEALARHGLEVERIWERDCNGIERPWSEDRGIEDQAERKRWLVIAILKRRRKSKGDRET